MSAFRRWREWRERRKGTPIVVHLEYKTWRGDWTTIATSSGGMLDGFSWAGDCRLRVVSSCGEVTVALPHAPLDNPDDEPTWAIQLRGSGEVLGSAIARNSVLIGWHFTNITLVYDDMGRSPEWGSR